MFLTSADLWSVSEALGELGGESDEVGPPKPTILSAEAPLLYQEC